MDQARARRCKFNLIAGEGKAKQDFGIAMRSHEDAWNILLSDAEGPDSGDLTARLITHQGWSNEHQDSIFWMVEMMESWFHADKDALGRFYKDGFNARAMAANPNVERIGKRDLRDGLKAATKGAYHKTRHALRLLEMIDPNLVRKAAPHCKRLFEAVLARLAENHQRGD